MRAAALRTVRLRSRAFPRWMAAFPAIVAHIVTLEEVESLPTVVLIVIADIRTVV